MKLKSIVSVSYTHLKYSGGKWWGYRWVSCNVAKVNEVDFSDREETVSYTHLHKTFIRAKDSN